MATSQDHQRVIYAEGPRNAGFLTRGGGGMGVTGRFGRITPHMDASPMPMPMTDRRRTDSASHAHKRAGDSEIFARLHQRLDDNDKIQAELIKSKVELFDLMKETNSALNALALSQSALVDEMSKTIKLREFADDVSGMMGLMVRFNNGIGVLWKPMLFIAVLGGTLYLWIVGGKPPP